MIALSDAIHEFIIACESDGMSAAALRWYRSLLKPLGEQLRATPLHEVGIGQLREFVVLLRRRGRPSGKMLSSHSIDCYVRATKRLFAWCASEYQIADPALRLKRPRKADLAPKAADLADWRRMVAACDKSAEGLRARAILLFLADTGCRAQGLLGLRDTDIDWVSNVATVFEKGAQSRPVPFGAATARALREWSRVRPKTATPYLFTSLRSRDAGTPLKISGLRLLLRRMAKTAGVSGLVNPHSFRHMFAREAARRGINLAVLAQLLGHKDVRTTTRSYARFALKEIFDQHRQYSPVRSLEEE